MSQQHHCIKPLIISISFAFLLLIIFLFQSEHEVYGYGWHQILLALIPAWYSNNNSSTTSLLQPNTTDNIQPKKNGSGIHTISPSVIRVWETNPISSMNYSIPQEVKHMLCTPSNALFFYGHLI